MCAGGALGPRPGAGGGLRAGRFRVGSPAPPSSVLPLLRPLRGQALGGPPREARGVRAALAPRHALDRGPSSPGPWRLPGRRPGSAPRPGVPAPRPWGSPGGAAAALGGGSVPASLVPPFPLPQVASGACGLRGGNRGPEPLSRREWRWALSLAGLSLAGETFPNPSPGPSTLLCHLVL